MKHHESPPPNLASLRARLTNAAAAESLSVGRVQRYVGVAVAVEILGALTDDAGPRFLVKGGSALELRLGLGGSRTSKDLDGVFRGDFDEFFAGAQVALRSGWAGFTGRATEPDEIVVPGMPVRPRRFAVKLEYHGRPFVTVPVEVAPDEAGLAAEHDSVQPTELDGLTALGLPRPDPVPCISIRWQLAQKLHACTDPLDGVTANDRARDLPDILMLAALITDEHLPSVREACLAVFAASPVRRGSSGGRRSGPTARRWPTTDGLRSPGANPAVDAAFSARSLCGVASDASWGAHGGARVPWLFLSAALVAIG